MIDLDICPKCKKPRMKQIEIPSLGLEGGEPMKMTVRAMCDCEAAAHEKMIREKEAEESMRQISKLRRLSLIDERLSKASIRTYRITEKNREQFKIAQKYIETFDQMKKSGQGLLFYGDVGTGKSYTAAMIANELIIRREPVVMTSLLKLIKDKPFGEYSDMELMRLNAASILILDDFGAERSTDYAVEQVYEIIDSRYRSQKPLIITSNVSYEEMQNNQDIRYDRIYDRVFEMCYPVPFEGGSWRTKAAATRFDQMKKILGGQ